MALSLPQREPRRAGGTETWTELCHRGGSALDTQTSSDLLTLVGLYNFLLSSPNPSHSFLEPSGYRLPCPGMKVIPGQRPPGLERQGWSIVAGLLGQLGLCCFCYT